MLLAATLITFLIPIQPIATPPDSKTSQAIHAEYVKSSWYDNGCEILHNGKQHCNTTRADGHPYDKMAMTVAHKPLPFGTKLLLYNPSNGRQVVVTVRDRGPFIKGR